jgi:protein phosphatase PTC7
MQNLKIEVEKCQSYNQRLPSNQKLIENAFDQTKVGAASTILVLSLNPTTPNLETSQIGDSGFILLRKDPNRGWRVVVNYLSMQSEFNRPLQLSHDHKHTVPSKALSNSYVVKHNDVIVAGSDGLWDNLYNNQIIYEITKATSENGLINDPHALAHSITQLARSYSLNKNYKSPFQTHAQSHGRENTGGKEDDITVIVAQIQTGDVDCEL